MSLNFVVIFLGKMCIQESNKTYLYITKIQEFPCHVINISLECSDTVFPDIMLSYLPAVYVFLRCCLYHYCLAGVGCPKKRNLFLIQAFNWPTVPTVALNICTKQEPNPWTFDSPPTGKFIWRGYWGGMGVQLVNWTIWSDKKFRFWDTLGRGSVFQWIW